MNDWIDEVPKCGQFENIVSLKKCGHSWNDEICVKFLCKIKFNTLDNFKKMFKYFFKTYLKIFKKKTEEDTSWNGHFGTIRAKMTVLGVIMAVLWDEMTVLKGQISRSLGQKWPLGYN